VRVRNGSLDIGWMDGGMMRKERGDGGRNTKCGWCMAVWGSLWS